MFDNKVLAILVAVAYVVMLIANGVMSNTTFVESLGGLDNAKISNSNPTYLTPDGLTFAIWGVIYLGEFVFSVFQALPANHDDKEFVAARPYVIAAFLLNASWLVIFSFKLWWLSTAVIAAYLGALFTVYREMHINYLFSSSKSLVYRACSFIGFSANIAWVTIATVLNLTLTLRQNGYVTAVIGGGDAIGANEDWAIMFIVLVAAISSTISFYRGDLVHNLTTAWAYSGIIRMQTIANATRFPVNYLSGVIASWALAGEIIVLVVALLTVIRFVVESRNESASKPIGEKGTSDYGRA